LTPGYTGLVPATLLDPADPVAQRIAGVGWRETAAGWVSVPGTMPRARLVSAVQPSVDVKADVHRIDIAGVALVDAPVPGLSGLPANSPGEHGAVRMVEDRPGSIVLETTAASQQLLILTERFHNGWGVTVDGTERAPVRVYGDFLGSAVDSGQHRVAFIFAPASARYGLRASLVGAALTLAVAIVLGVPRTHARKVESRGARL
ncbi:MAG: hypothetical protein ACRD2I_05695, partial [Vicinamibacterales bacterium]